MSPRHHLTQDEFNAFWAIMSAIVLIPSFCMWAKRRLETERPRDAWRRADQRGRMQAREERRNGR
jgi:hypothetical protein